MGSIETIVVVGDAPVVFGGELEYATSDQENYCYTTDPPSSGVRIDETGND